MVLPPKHNPFFRAGATDEQVDEAMGYLYDAAEARRAYFALAEELGVSYDAAESLWDEQV